MTKKEMWRLLHDKSKIEYYISGKFKSKYYTDEELKEKRKYFENQEIDTKFGISQSRWLYEIKRVFELSKDFKEFPDCGLYRLEFMLKFGA